MDVLPSSETFNDVPSRWRLHPLGPFNILLQYMSKIGGEGIRILCCDRSPFSSFGAKMPPDRSAKEGKRGASKKVDKSSIAPYNKPDPINPPTSPSSPKNTKGSNASSGSRIDNDKLRIPEGTPTAPRAYKNMKFHKKIELPPGDLKNLRKLPSFDKVNRRSRSLSPIRRSHNKVDPYPPFYFEEPTIRIPHGSSRFRTAIEEQEYHRARVAAMRGVCNRIQEIHELSTVPHGNSTGTSTADAYDSRAILKISEAFLDILALGSNVVELKFDKLIEKKEVENLRVELALQQRKYEEFTRIEKTNRSLVNFRDSTLDTVDPNESVIRDAVTKDCPWLPYLKAKEVVDWQVKYSENRDPAAASAFISGFMNVVSEFEYKFGAIKRAKMNYDALVTSLDGWIAKNSKWIDDAKVEEEQMD